MIGQKVMAGSLSIAVVGSGIAGLSAAWLLSKKHRVTLLERDTRAGGHSNTVDVQMPDGPVAVDTGFIVYNTASYPNLIALLEHLDVPTVPTAMGFSVSLDRGGYEYSGNGLTGLFGQPSNIARPDHWRMIADLLRFFREARSDMDGRHSTDGLTLGQYLAANHYSDAFVRRHILPMAAAIWSTPSSEIMQYPAASFVRFFANHGLLQVNNRPDWRTVVGGSRTYVTRLLTSMGDNVVLGSPVRTITRTVGGVSVIHGDRRQVFDACVIATHADDALALLGDADDRERQVLGAFRYTSNRAVLHTDPAFMPRRRRVWSSWNYRSGISDADESLSLTYWMNALQPLATRRELFVTLNPAQPLRDDAVIAAFDYRHPLFDSAASSMQSELWGLQGTRNTWFCGSYFGYGFHEDGLQAGLAVAEDIGGVRRPWQVENESSRIQLRRAADLSSPIVEAAE